MQTGKGKNQNYRFVKPGYRLAMWIIDRLGALWYSGRKAVPAPEIVKSVLLVKLNNIGDGMSLFPVARLLKEAYPEVRIDILTRPTVAPLYQNWDDITYVFEMNPFEAYRGNETPILPEERRTIRDLIRSVNYDVIFEFRGDIRISQFLNTAKPRFLVGFSDGGGQFYHHRTLTPDPAWNFISHDVQLLSVLPPFQDQTEIDFPLFFPVVQKTDQIARRYLKKRQLEPGKFLIIHPGAGMPLKRMTADDIRHVLSQLAKPHPPIIFTAAPDELDHVHHLQSELGTEFRIPVAKTRTLFHLAALMALAERIICTDSAGMHLAGFLQKPMIPVVRGVLLNHALEQHQRYWLPYATIQFTYVPEQHDSASRRTSLTPC